METSWFNHFWSFGVCDGWPILSNHGVARVRCVRSDHGFRWCKPRKAKRASWANPGVARFVARNIIEEKIWNFPAGVDYQINPDYILRMNLQNATKRHSWLVIISPWTYGPRNSAARMDLWQTDSCFSMFFSKFWRFIPLWESFTSQSVEFQDTQRCFTVEAKAHANAGKAWGSRRSLRGGVFRLVFPIKAITQWGIHSNKLSPITSRPFGSCCKSSQDTPSRCPFQQWHVVWMVYCELPLEGKWLSQICHDKTYSLFATPMKRSNTRLQGMFVVGKQLIPMVGKRERRHHD